MERTDNKQLTQSILGSGGIIGKHIALSLPAYTSKIRLVSRNPRAVNTTDTTFTADLLIKDQAACAVAGSDVVYLVAGLPYSTSAWKQQWPVLMRNVIEACKKHRAKLVFFDNVYALGKVNGWMREDTPMNPCSKKGQVRAEIATMVLDEMRAGNLEAIIARSADFYGPETPLSFVQVMVFERLMKGKTPQWLLNADVRHSFTFTPDAGKATALLGNTPDAFNQIWNLPTDRNVMTGREFLDACARAFHRPATCTVLSRWNLALAGLFVPALRESMEMLYQSEFDYLFDSSKFDSAFHTAPTRYPDGIDRLHAFMTEGRA